MGDGEKSSEEGSFNAQSAPGKFSYICTGELGGPNSDIIADGSISSLSRLSRGFDKETLARA